MEVSPEANGNEGSFKAGGSEAGTNSESEPYYSPRDDIEAEKEAAKRNRELREKRRNSCS